MDRKVKKAYIILAHKNGEQIKRLTDRLDDGLSTFFIHIDKRSKLKIDRKDFGNKCNVIMVPQVRTSWGKFGIVEATVQSMLAIRNSKETFDRIILLSGQDYPIKNNDHINNFLRSSSYKVFMEYLTLPDFNKWNSGGGSYRVDKYFLGFSPYLKLAARSLNFLSRYAKFLKRRLHTEIEHFYGSQWWIMDWATFNYTLDYIVRNPNYKSFHYYTFAPDELFFQTIVLNSTLPAIRQTLMNDHLRFMKWCDASSAHPEFLVKEDFEEIKNSGALFARKFDPQLDAEILNMIDTYCLNNQPINNG